MQKKFFLAGGAVVLLIGILAGFLLLGPKTGPYDPIAKCLSEKGYRMYGTSWCSHCLNQKKLFGSSFRYIDYIECGTGDAYQVSEFCTRLGINAFPTWEFPNGTMREGEVSIGELAVISGCGLR